MSSRPSELCLATVLRPELHEDERGWLFEIVSSAAPFDAAQIYAVGVAPGATRGKHYHKHKTEVFAVVSGACRLELRAFGGRRESIVLGPAGGEALAAVIPAGVWHAFTNGAAAGEDAVVIAIADEYYDPEDEDTYREMPVGRGEYFDG